MGLPDFVRIVEVLAIIRTGKGARLKFQDSSRYEIVPHSWNAGRRDSVEKTM